MPSQNVKVSVRIRPLVESEAGDSEAFVKVKNLVQEEGSNHGTPFTHVFDKHASNAKVFDTAAKGMVRKVLDGYNATIFMYGQTGSGKTWTMTGTPEQPGMSRAGGAEPGPAPHSRSPPQPAAAACCLLRQCGSRALG